MKTLRYFLKSAALLAVTALVTTASAANPGALKGSGKIYDIKGSATVNGAPAYLGQIVSEGSTITTGAASETSIDLGVNGGLLSIKAGSTITLEKLEIKGASSADTLLDLKEGKIHGNVKKVSAASKYEIKTAKGVAGIRGTSFILGADGSATVTSGTVVMIFVVGGVPSAPVTVTAGQTVTPPTTPGGVPQVGTASASATGTVVVVPEPTTDAPEGPAAVPVAPTVTITPPPAYVEGEVKYEIRHEVP